MEVGVTVRDHIVTVAEGPDIMAIPLLEEVLHRAEAILVDLLVLTVPDQVVALVA